MSGCQSSVDRMAPFAYFGRNQKGLCFVYKGDLFERKRRRLSRRRLSHPWPRTRCGARNPLLDQPGCYGQYAILAERALDLIVKGEVNLSPLATHALPLTQYREGVELLRKKEAIKVCFDPWGA